MSTPLKKKPMTDANHPTSHVPDNKGVNYQVFVRALHNYAKAQMRFGR